jgi:hypothetical protein
MQKCREECIHPGESMAHADKPQSRWLFRPSANWTPPLGERRDRSRRGRARHRCQRWAICVLYADP